MHCRGSIDRDLLLENNVQKRRKAIPPAAKTRLAGLLEDRGEDRFGGKYGYPVDKATRGIAVHLCGRHCALGGDASRPA
jgi:hypothetical protein